MDRGYFPVFRRIFDSDIWGHKIARDVWIFILGNVTHYPTKLCANYGCIDLEPGQMVTGLHTIAERNGFSYQQIRTAIDYLISTNRITRHPTKRYSIITVCNWDIYREAQFGEQPTKQPSEQPTGNQQVTNRQPTDNHIQEVKKLRSKEKPNTPTAAETAAMKLVEYYEKEIRKDQSSRYRARKNAEALLKNGCTKEVLWECVNLYANDADHKDPQFRKVAANFFGRDAVYKNYEDEAKRIVEVEYAKEG